MKVYVIKENGNPVDVFLRKTHAHSVAYSYWMKAREKEEVPQNAFTVVAYEANEINTQSDT